MENQKNQYGYISTLSNKIKVLIIGGQKSAFIKFKTFFNSGAFVYVLSEDFLPDFFQYEKEERVFLIKKTYTEEAILDKHIIVIALSKEDTIKKIEEDCKKHFKLFLSCCDFSRGNFVTPYQRESSSLSFGINIKEGNPAISRFIGEKFLKEAKKYDSFIQFANFIRKNSLGKSFKEELMRFIATEDFYYFFNKGSHKTIIRMFYFDSILADKDLAAVNGGRDFDI